MSPDDIFIIAALYKVMTLPFVSQPRPLKLGVGSDPCPRTVDRVHETTRFPWQFFPQQLPRHLLRHEARTTTHGTHDGALRIYRS
jgi:hypothetical protein